MKKVIIIGAGPAGLTAGYELSKLGVQVEIVEASDRVGGMAASFELWGQRVDLGPHRYFSTDNRINQIWKEVLKGQYESVNRMTRIYYKGKFFHYPLRPMDALSKLGLFEAFRCMLSFVKAQLLPADPKAGGTFEGWVVSRFGRRLFEIFFKTYSEKLWGISCRDLDSDFAAQRIKSLSLLEP